MCAKVGWCKIGWCVWKLACARPEISQVGRCMAVRVHLEKALSAEEEQECQVLVESVGHKSGRLEMRLVLGSLRKRTRRYETTILIYTRL